MEDKHIMEVMLRFDRYCENNEDCSDCPFHAACSDFLVDLDDDIAIDKISQLLEKEGY